MCQVDHLDSHFMLQDMLITQNELKWPNMMYRKCDAFNFCFESSFVFCHAHLFDYP